MRKKIAIFLDDLFVLLAMCFPIFYIFKWLYSKFDKKRTKNSFRFCLKIWWRFSIYAYLWGVFCVYFHEKINKFAIFLIRKCNLNRDESLAANMIYLSILYSRRPFELKKYLDDDEIDAILKSEGML